MIVWGQLKLLNMNKKHFTGVHVICFYMHEQRHVYSWLENLFWTIVLDTKLLVARPRMSNLQLFPVSSLLIESMLPVDSIADGAPAVIQLEWSWVWAPGEPDCACLFRSLESILCSVREDSCYYRSVLFFSSIPSSSFPPLEGRIPHGNSPTLGD